MAEDQTQGKKKTGLPSICIYILTALAILYTTYLAQNLILLIVVAVIVSLLLSPGVKLLEKLYVPRVVGSAFLILALLAPTTALILQLQSPIAKWAEMLPQLSEHVTEQLAEINQAIESSTKVVKPKEDKGWFSWFSSDDEEVIEEKPNIIETRLKESLFTVVSDFLVSAPFVAVQIITTIVLILFTLVYSPTLFRQYVKLFVSEEKQTSVHTFALSAQQQLSQYILTVSSINIVLGLVCVIFLYSIGLKDALLLGSLVGLLNFIPYVGPFIALSLILIGALVQWGADINTVLAVGGILTINVIESQFVNPMVLAKNMRINPLLIVVWLLICGWLWGIIGVVIAVPLAVCIKLILEQFERTKPWVKLIMT